MLQIFRELYFMEIGFQNVVRNFYFDNESEYRVEVIDTWEKAIKEAGVFKGKFTVELSGKEYMAIRIRNIKPQM